MHFPHDILIKFLLVLICKFRCSEDLDLLDELFDLELEIQRHRLLLRFEIVNTVSIMAQQLCHRCFISVLIILLFSLDHLKEEGRLQCFKWEVILIHLEQILSYYNIKSITKETKHVQGQRGLLFFLGWTRYLSCNWKNVNCGAYHIGGASCLYF